MLPRVIVRLSAGFSLTLVLLAALAVSSSAEATQATAQGPTTRGQVPARPAAPAPPARDIVELVAEKAIEIKTAGDGIESVTVQVEDDDRPGHRSHPGYVLRGVQRLGPEHGRDGPTNASTGGLSLAHHLGARRLRQPAQGHPRIGRHLLRRAFAVPGRTRPVDAGAREGRRGLRRPTGRGLDRNG